MKIASPTLHSIFASPWQASFLHLTNGGSSPSFPRRTLSPALATERVAFRYATDNDIIFMRDIHHALRADELSALPWSPHEKRAFLDQQFAWQLRHYLTVFPEAEFLVIESAGAPVGRVFFTDTGNAFRLVDIALLPAWRNKGIGTNVLRALQRLAAAAGAGAIVLHVEHGNVGARRVYRRLSFREAESGPAHLRMEWTAAS